MQYGHPVLKSGSKTPQPRWCRSIALFFVSPWHRRSIRPLLSANDSSISAHCTLIGLHPMVLTICGYLRLHLSKRIPPQAVGMLTEQRDRLTASRRRLRGSHHTLCWIVAMYNDTMGLVPGEPCLSPDTAQASLLRHGGASSGDVAERHQETSRHAGKPRGGGLPYRASSGCEHLRLSTNSSKLALSRVESETQCSQVLHVATWTG